MRVARRLNTSLAILLASSSCFTARGQATSFTLGEAAIACDWAMTAWMARHYDDGYVELNVLMGRHPSQEKIATAMIAGLVSNAIIFLAPKEIIPTWFKAGWLPYVAGLEMANDLVFNPSGHALCSPR